MALSLLTLLVAMPGQAAAPAPEAEPPMGEEVLDGDGYLGLRLGEGLDEKGLAKRLGPPLEVAFPAEEGGHPVRLLSWGPPGQGHAPEGKALRVLVEQEASGWRLTEAGVGAGFRLPPLVRGQPLGLRQALKAALPGHVDTGELLLSHLEGLSFGPDPWRPEAMGMLSLLPRRFDRFAANSARAHDTLFQWRRHHRIADVQALRLSLEGGPDQGSLLSPAVVRSTKLDPARPGWRLLHFRLPQHSLVVGGDDPTELGPPKQEGVIRIPAVGTGAELKAGDVVLLRGAFVGIAERAHGEVPLRHPEGRVLLVNLSLYAACPSQGFPLFQLWQGAPLPSSR